MVANSTPTPATTAGWGAHRMRAGHYRGTHYPATTTRRACPFLPFLAFLGSSGRVVVARVAVHYYPMRWIYAQ